MTEFWDRPITLPRRRTRSDDAVGINPAIGGAGELAGVRIRPVKYRYVMANIRTGKMIAVMPMTSVSYTVGFYSGTDMSGTVYLPDMWLMQMPHAPGCQYAQWKHPEKSDLIGSKFEVGNVAIYVMRNEEVVWGGILWSRAYSSGDKTMAITAVSWEAYIYYRAIRKTVAFPSTNPKTERYTIWRGLLAQVLAMGTTSDFGWTGDDGNYLNAGVKLAEGTWGKPWTGLYDQRPPVAYDEYWPYNSPPIELPPPGLSSGLTLTSINESWQGFQMDNVGSQLEQFANINNLITGDGFEYRVLCWWDANQEKFRQRYSFGEMEYSAPNDATKPDYHTDYTSTPIGIRSQAFGQSYDNAGKTIFDYPGHVSQWSLSESMENAATRVIVTGGAEDTKIAAYAADKEMLRGTTGTGTNGWLLYDKVFNYETTKRDDADGETGIETRADVLLAHHHVPVAAQINDLENANSSSTVRASQRSTELSITLYKDPTTEFPPWKIGDWVTFAISDALYGGTMYLKRRIIRYTTTVIPDHESDYSNEQISLELTDETKVEAGG